MPKIRSIQTIDQYAMTNNSGRDVLLTVVGEMHDEETDCNTDQIRLSQFVEERLRNPETGNMLLLLEYEPGLDRNIIARFGSSVLREIYSTRDCPLAYEKAVGIDIRTRMIGRVNQTELYNKPDLAFLKDMLKKDINQFVHFFVNNIWQSDFLKQILENKDCKENPIMDVCLRKINQFHSNVIHLLQQQLQNEAQLDEILFYTRQLWACIMDLNILQMALCQNYGYDEIVVVIGTNHSENIKQIISLIIPSQNRQHLTGCVDTEDIWKY